MYYASVKTGAKYKGRRPTPFLDKEGSRVTYKLNIKT